MSRHRMSRVRKLPPGLNSTSHRRTRVASPAREHVVLHSSRPRCRQSPHSGGVVADCAVTPQVAAAVRRMRASTRWGGTVLPVGALTVISAPFGVAAACAGLIVATPAVMQAIDNYGAVPKREFVHAPPSVLQPPSSSYTSAMGSLGLAPWAAAVARVDLASPLPPMFEPPKPDTASGDAPPRVQADYSAPHQTSAPSPGPPAPAPGGWHAGGHGGWHQGGETPPPGQPGDTGTGTSGDDHGHHGGLGSVLGGVLGHHPHSSDSDGSSSGESSHDDGPDNSGSGDSHSDSSGDSRHESHTDSGSHGHGGRR